MFKFIGENISIKPYPADIWVDEAIRLRKAGIASSEILPMLQWMQTLPVELPEANNG